MMMGRQMAKSGHFCQGQVIIQVQRWESSQN